MLDTLGLLIIYHLFINSFIYYFTNILIYLFFQFINFLKSPLVIINTPLI